jgi:hypothetical protein
MIIKSCLSCEYHEMEQDGKEETSHCRRENCWCRYSKCVLGKALERFLKEESARHDRSFSSF